MCEADQNTSSAAGGEATRRARGAGRIVSEMVSDGGGIARVVRAAALIWKSKAGSGRARPDEVSLETGRVGRLRGPPPGQGPQERVFNRFEAGIPHHYRRGR